MISKSRRLTFLYISMQVLTQSTRLQGHPKDKGLLSHETTYASGLWYLHSHPMQRGATVRQEDRVRTRFERKGNQRLERNETFSTHLHLNVLRPMGP
jgi:hypothetical protein